MRQIGTLPEQPLAERFRDWLQTRDIEARIEPESGDWAIWVVEEDMLETARDELANFERDPEAERYLTATVAVRQQRRHEQKQQRQVPRPATHVPANTWVRPAWNRCRATVVLIALSVLVTLVCLKGFKQAFDFEMRYEPVMTRLTIVPVSGFGRAGADPWEPDIGRFIRTQTDRWKAGEPLQVPRTGVGRIIRGEAWRLVTPIFLHFSVLHILFNMLWLRELGGAIEDRRGPVKYLGLVLLIAVVSNVGQYWITGQPLFGGMSGVVYGLFGYIWLKQRVEPAAGLALPPMAAFWMIGWFVLCWTGTFGNIANWAHTFGLFTGMLTGLLPTRPVTRT